MAEVLAGGGIFVHSQPPLQMEQVCCFLELRVRPRESSESSGPGGRSGQIPQLLVGGQVVAVFPHWP